MPRRLPGDTLREKLLLNHVKVGDCWRWTGAHTPSGYGHLYFARKSRAVHRLSLLEFRGVPLDAIGEVDHLCGTRDCINPDHLEVVSRRVNIERSNGPSALNARKTHCVHGHEFNAINTRITAEGYRVCRPCKRASNRRWKQRRAVA